MHIYKVKTKLLRFCGQRFENITLTIKRGNIKSQPFDGYRPSKCQNTRVGLQNLLKIQF